MRARVVDDTGREGAPTPTIPHAASRWARAVGGVLECSFDPKTIEAWGEFIGASGSTIRQWCRSAGVKPKASLDFARLLRAVVLTQGQSWDLYNVLDVVDERTMHNLFSRGGIADLVEAARPPETSQFLAQQRFVSREPALQAIASLLRSTASENAPTQP